jgi:CubicO group peptidase (beta-lactamase class C family)
MRGWLAVQLVLVGAVPVGVVPLAPDPAAPASDVGAYLREYRAAHRIPGLAYAIVSRDRVVSTATYGVDGSGAPVTGRTPFLIGSVSKPFTALAVLQLAEAGRLRLDDPVRQHLPWFRLADDGAAGRVTVRHLLTHTSGLAQWAVRTDRFDNTAGGIARSVRDLSTVDLATPPGAVHEYSDANYAVLGALVEQVAGEPFGDHLRRAVFAPLDMRDSAANAADAARVGLPAGHRYWFGRPHRFDPGYDASGAPYGYIAASVDDLTHFARAQLGGGAPVLSAAGIALAHTGQVDTGGGGRYGLGWRESDLDGHRAVWHAGATPGYFTNLVLVPDAGIGVIVQVNAYSPALDGALAAAAFDVARLALGRTAEGSSGADPLLTGTLYGLVAVALLLLVGVGWAIARAVRPRGRVATGAVWIIGCAVLSALAALALPAALGADLRQALLWTPDIGRAIVTVAASAGALATTRAVVVARVLYARR